MTKILRCLLIIFLCVAMLASCQFGKQTTTTTTYGVDCVLRMPFCYTLEDYNALIEKYYYTKEFISYDCLSDLGEFDKFYPGGLIPKEDYSEENMESVDYSTENYMYYLKGQNEDVLLKILVINESFTSSSLIKSTDYIHIEEKPESFLTSELSKIEYNGIYYVYGEKISKDSEQRKISKIILFENNNTIEISGCIGFADADLHDYLYDDIIQGDNLLACLLSGNPEDIDLCVKYLNASPINIEKLDSGEAYVNGTLIEEGMEFFDFIDVLDRYGKFYHIWGTYLIWSDSLDNDMLYIYVLPDESGVPFISFVDVRDKEDIKKDVQINENGELFIEGVEIENKTTYSELVDIMGVEGLFDIGNRSYVWEISDREGIVISFDKEGQFFFEIKHKEEIDLFLYF